MHESMFGKTQTCLFHMTSTVPQQGTAAMFDLVVKVKLTVDSFLRSQQRDVHTWSTSQVAQP